MKHLPERSTIPAILDFLGDVLEDHQRMGQPVFFIVEEVDRFCTKGSQTLLYTISDFLQSAEVQIAFIGLTSRLDFPQLLEKRLRSRLAFRRVFCPQISSTEVLLKCLESALTYREPAPALHRESSQGAASEGRHVDGSAKGPDASSPLLPEQQTVEAYDSAIRQLLSDQVHPSLSLARLVPSSPQLFLHPDCILCNVIVCMFFPPVRTCSRPWGTSYSRHSAPPCPPSTVLPAPCFLTCPLPTRRQPPPHQQPKPQLPPQQPLTPSRSLSLFSLLPLFPALRCSCRTSRPCGPICAQRSFASAQNWYRVPLLVSPP